MMERHQRCHLHHLMHTVFPLLNNVHINPLGVTFASDIPQLSAVFATQVVVTTTTIIIIIIIIITILQNIYYDYRYIYWPFFR